MDVTNPLFFIVDCMKMVAVVLTNYRIFNVSIWHWFIMFIFVGMVVSVFWRGARG